MKFSSLVALKVVKVTTFSATGDENAIKMTTFPFQVLYQFTQAHVMYAYLTFIIVDWYKASLVSDVYCFKIIEQIIFI